MEEMALGALEGKDKDEDTDIDKRQRHTCAACKEEEALGAL